MPSLPPVQRREDAVELRPSHKRGGPAARACEWENVEPAAGHLAAVGAVNTFGVASGGKPLKKRSFVLDKFFRWLRFKREEFGLQRQMFALKRRMLRNKFLMFYMEVRMGVCLARMVGVQVFIAAGHVFALVLRKLQALALDLAERERGNQSPKKLHDGR